MSLGNHHIIHQQWLEIEHKRQQNIYKVQDQVRDWFYKDVVNTLQTTMDDISRPDQFVFIDDLHIDLGEVSFSKSEYITQEALRKLLKEAMQDKLQEIEAVKTTATPQDGTSPFSPSQTGVRIMGKRLATFTFFLEYLERGVMPLWYPFQSIVILEKELQKSREEIKNHFNRLADLASLKPYVLDRLLYHFSQDLISFIIQLGCNTNPDNSILQAIYQYLAEHTSVYGERFKYVLSKSLLSQILDIRRPVSSGSSEPLQIIFHYLPKNHWITFNDLVDRFKKEVEKPKDSNQSILVVIEKFLSSGFYQKEVKPLVADVEYPLLDNKVDTLRPYESEAQQADKEINTHTSTGETNEVSLFEKDEISPRKIADHIMNDGEGATQQAGYYTNNAGLVLFSPYLEMFLTEIGLMKKTEFVDADSKERAVNVLHYLTHGEAESTENDFVLNKLICGLEIHEPVRCNITLSVDEKREADNLLNAVIRNWTALKKTSPDGLREGFLRREGTMIQSADGWKLTVEQTSLDILLTSLPWGFNVVKLPWMELPIFVKWT